METNIIEQSAALALLDRGVGFKIPAPFLFRLFGKKTVSISVKRLRLGTLVHLDAIDNLGIKEPVPMGEARTQTLELMDAKAESLSLSIILEQRKPVSIAIAACLLNSPLKIVLFTKLLSWHLRRTCTSDIFQELIVWIYAYGRVESFTNTIRLLQAMKMMKPRNLSPEEERS